MSQENVEIVRAHFEAFNRGDFGAPFASCTIPTSTCVDARRPDADGPFRGRERSAMLEASSSARGPRASSRGGPIDARRRSGARGRSSRVATGKGRADVEMDRASRSRRVTVRDGQDRPRQGLPRSKPKPSKPPGCRSRRCRRRTWRSCGRPLPRSTDATWITGSSSSTPRSSTTTRPNFPMAVCTWAVRLFAAMSRVISTLGPMRAWKSMLARSENRWLAGFGHTGSGEGDRHRGRDCGVRGAVRLPRRAHPSRPPVRNLRRGPRSRRAAGVGDVAGERGVRRRASSPGPSELDKRDAARRSAPSLIAQSLPHPRSSGWRIHGEPTGASTGATRGVRESFAATGLRNFDGYGCEIERDGRLRRQGPRRLLQRGGARKPQRGDRSASGSTLVYTFRNGKVARLRGVLRRSGPSKPPGCRE